MGFLSKILKGISQEDHQRIINKQTKKYQAEIDGLKNSYDSQITELELAFNNQRNELKELQLSIIKKDKVLATFQNEITCLKDDIQSWQAKYSQQKESYIEQRTKEGRSYQDDTTSSKYCISDSLFAENDIAKAKSEMKSILEQNDYEVWTEAQEKMIFSNSRFVNVIAGAGSGKTTTMILRIIYMIKYLNIDIDHITVITFTNASRKDFTTKLSRVLAAFNEPYNYEYLWKNTVKTFHSKMLSIIKYCGLECNNLAKQVFEHLDSKNDTVNKEDNNQGISIDEQLDGLVEDASDTFYDLLAVESSVGSKKYAYLMECYFDLYSNQNDDAFKKLANYLFDMRQVKTPSRKNNISEVTILRMLETDDLMLTQKINQFCGELLSRDGATEIILPGNFCPEIEISIDTSKWSNQGIKKGYLHTNFYLPNNQLYVLFIPERQLINKNESNRIIFSNLELEFSNVTKFISKKVKWLNYWMQNINDEHKKILYINDFELLKYILHLENTGKEIAPIFDTAIKGEEDYPRQIFIAIYKLGSYFESLGINLIKTEYEELYNAIKGKDNLDEYDAKFLEATLIYFRRLKAILSTKSIYRYNELFQLSGSSDDPCNKDNLYSGELILEAKSLQHILIDEFQDISPLIAQWVKYYLNLNINEPYRETSLMSIGDNWQCIYGFRGSVPTYLSRDYQKIFPAKQDNQQITLQDNFRSAQKIIDNAQRVFGNSDEVKARGGVSKTNTTGRFLVDSNVIMSDSDKQVEGKLSEKNKDVKFYIQSAFDEYINYERKSETDYSLFILCTTGKQKDDAKKILKRIAKNAGLKDIPSHMKAMTIHKSKGLEAKCVIAIGDKNEPKKIPLKYCLYRHALGDGFCHKTAQFDECKNIIYVALSRAKDHVIFLYQPIKGGIAHNAFKRHIDGIRNQYYKDMSLFT